MKKMIYRWIMGIAAIIAVFLLGSIVNVKNDVYYLIGTVGTGALLTLGYFLGTEPKERSDEEE